MTFILCVSASCYTQKRTSIQDDKADIIAKKQSINLCHKISDIYINSYQFETYLMSFSSYIAEEGKWRDQFKQFYHLIQKLRNEENYLLSVQNSATEQDVSRAVALTEESRILKKKLDEFSKELIYMTEAFQVDPEEKSSRLSDQEKNPDQYEQFLRHTNPENDDETVDQDNTGHFFETLTNKEISAIISGLTISASLLYYNLRTASENKLTSVDLNNPQKETKTNDPETTRTLSIMTANVYAFPEYLKFLHPRTKKPTEERLRLFSDFLTDHKEGSEKKPDIIGIQEAWGTRNKKILQEKLKSQYPYIYWGDNLGRFFGSVDSGLMLVSRYPAQRIGYATWGERAGEDLLSRKGMLIGEFLDSDQKPFVVVTTHLQAGSSGFFHTIDKLLRKQSTAEITMHQIEDLSDKITEFVKKNPALSKTEGLRILITGDLNADLGYKKDGSPIDEWSSVLKTIQDKTKLKIHTPFHNSPDDDGIQSFDAKKHSTVWEGGKSTDVLIATDTVTFNQNVEVFREVLGTKEGDLSSGSEETAITDHAPSQISTDINMAEPPEKTGGFRTGSITTDSWKNKLLAYSFAGIAITTSIAVIVLAKRDQIKNWMGLTECSRPYKMQPAHNE